MKNCAFQYAKITTGFFRRTEIVCDKSKLTLEEAKQSDFWGKAAMVADDCEAALRQPIVMRSVLEDLRSQHITPTDANNVLVAGLRFKERFLNK